MRTIYIIGGIALALFALDRVSKSVVASQVTEAILEKIGPDAPDSMVEAAKAAGQCFADKATLPDLVRFGLSKI